MALKIEKETKTIKIMLKMYCQEFHSTSGSLCDDCEDLLAYSRQRLESCPFKDNKPKCAKCHIHCYKQSEKNKIKSVMKFSGPRMLLKHPLLTMQHLIQKKIKIANKK